MLAITSIFGLNNLVRAQSTTASDAMSSSCNQADAIEMIRQQVQATKTFSGSAQRISVLIRAADLLWTYKQQEARAAFAEAFDLANQNFKEKGDELKKEGRGLLVEIPDQRYVVIRAVAKRDATWAKMLTEEVLKKDREDAAEVGAKDTQRDIQTAWKLLDLATSLLSSDLNASTNYARASLKYPATVRLTIFLYKFAELDRQGADQFYQQALAVYGDKPARELLYLAAYPFGMDDAGDMPWSGSYTVPASFSPNVVLQRLFISTLLRRAQQALETPLDEGDNYNGLPGIGHLAEVLTQLEPQVRNNLPNLLAAVEQSRTNLLSALSPENQALLMTPKTQLDSTPRKTFDQQIEAAEKEPNVNKRDELFVIAILNASQAENLDHVVSVADKFSDSELRTQLLDWLYFNYTQRAVKDKRLNEARKLASKVEEMGQRAYLYSEIAKESLKTIENQSQARDLLDEIVETATKAPITVVTARALLSAAYLYLKLDPNRAISILGEAVKNINHLDSPDFSKQSLVRKIEGKNFVRYALFKTPGFDPENAFREMGKVAFDATLSQASGFTDKSLRALTTLVLEDICLQKVQQQEKAEKAAKKPKP